MIKSSDQTKSCSATILLDCSHVKNLAIMESFVVEDMEVNTIAWKFMNKESLTCTLKPYKTMR